MMARFIRQIIPAFCSALLIASPAVAELTYQGHPLAEAFSTQPQPPERVAPTKIETICYDGHLWERRCYGPGGSGPCTKGAPLAVFANDVQRHAECGGMSVLGTVAALSIAHGADLITTGAADRIIDPGVTGGDPLQTGRLTEGNPALKSTLELVGAKLIVIGGGTWLVHWIEGKNPKLAKWARRILVTGLGAVSVHNIRTAFENRPEVP